MRNGRWLCAMAGVLTMTAMGMRTEAAEADAPVPPVVGLERLESWRAGVAAADRGERPLVVVCLGDSNTEGAGYVAELRHILQGCYGERGVGYLTFGKRNEVAGAPEIERAGEWRDFRTVQYPPPKEWLPKPWLAPDGIWVETGDAGAALDVSFFQGPWGEAAERRLRAYDGQQRVRIHYRKGPGLGAFTVAPAGRDPIRVECAADADEYAVTAPFLAERFSIRDIRGRVALFGLQSERFSLIRNRPVLRGGALVHALGAGGAQAWHAAEVEESAYRGFFEAVRPDLIILVFGTNDMNHDGNPARYRLADLIRKLQAAAPGVGVLAVSCPDHVWSHGRGGGYNRVAAEAADAEGAAYWDLHGLIDYGRWIQEGFFADQLHYNRLGGGLWARLMLRQLGFDLNNLSHYPVLRPRPAAETETVSVPRRPAVAGLDAVAAALEGVEPLPFWNQDRQVADIGLAVAGPALALRARVHSAAFGADPAKWPGGGFDVYVARPADQPNGHLVRQLAFRMGPGGAADGWIGIKESGISPEGRRMVLPSVEVPIEDFPAAATPLAPQGFEIRGLVPLAALGLDEKTDTFRVEFSLALPRGDGQGVEFLRLFATHPSPDAGAFRDPAPFATVRVGE